jgi:hypothetical protein
MTMGVPRQVFSSARRLNAAEAAVLAGEVMARAQLALHQSQARRSRRRLRAIAASLRRVLGPWYECIGIGLVMLACLTGIVIHAWN